MNHTADIIPLLKANAQYWISTTSTPWHHRWVGNEIGQCAFRNVSSSFPQTTNLGVNKFAELAASAFSGLSSKALSGYSWVGAQAGTLTAGVSTVAASLAGSVGPTLANNFPLIASHAALLTIVHYRFTAGLNKTEEQPRSPDISTTGVATRTFATLKDLGLVSTIAFSASLGVACLSCYDPTLFNKLSLLMQGVNLISHAIYRNGMQAKEIQTLTKNNTFLNLACNALDAQNAFQAARTDTLQVQLQHTESALDAMFSHQLALAMTTPSALYSLIDLHVYGHIAVDAETQKTLWDKLNELEPSDTKTCYLAIAGLIGFGTDINHAQAIPSLLPLVQQEEPFPLAQAVLSTCYREGVGVDQDADLASFFWSAIPEEQRPTQPFVFRLNPVLN